jgi:RND family efflux transporter MFP subunit
MNTRKIKLHTLLTFVPLFIFGCSNKNESVKEILRPVRFQEVNNLSGEQTRTFSGVSKAGMETNLSFKVGGTINYVNVKIGERIKKNALIATLDDSDYQLKYEQSHASEDNAKTQRELAKSNYKRIEKLYENGNISISEYQEAKAAHESAKDQVKALDRQTDQFRKQIEYTKLYAPMDGIIAGLYVEKNENVQPGQIICEFNSESDPEVTVGIPESFITRVKEGDHVTIEFSSIIDQVFMATITEVSYALEQQSSTYPVIVKLLNPTNEIRPGMAADVTFNFQSKKEEDNNIVPSVAVAEDQSGNYVYVIEKIAKDTAIVHKRPVKVGILIEESFEILEGLEGGELVVTAGISKLTDGMKVKLLN